MTPKIIGRVKAIHAFQVKEPFSLNFNKGDYIDVLAKLESGWWDGWCNGKRGWFPSNYVESLPVLQRISSSSTLNSDNEENNNNMIDIDPEQLMQKWVERKTPQGRIYYCNLITQETTWDYNEIDENTGQLKRQQQLASDIDNNDNNNDDDDNDLMIPRQRIPTKDIPSSPIKNNDSHNESESQENNNMLSWNKIATDIAQAIHELLQVSQEERIQELHPKTGAVVTTVRFMLYSSRSLEKDKNYNPAFREPRRAVMASLSKLVLSAKLGSEMSPTLSPCFHLTFQKIKKDANDVLIAVRNFVSLCQQRKVMVQHMYPRFIQPELKHGESLDETTTTTTAAAVEGDEKRKNLPLNADLVISLQTHTNQIYMSTEELSMSLSNIFIKHQQQKKYTKERDEIVHLFKSFSGYISQYIVLLDDINMIHTSLLFEKYIVSRQALYTAIGKLFSAIQNLTASPDSARNHSKKSYQMTEWIQAVEFAIVNVENVVEDIEKHVMHMVEERMLSLSNGREEKLTVLNDPTFHTFESGEYEYDENENGNDGDGENNHEDDNNGDERRFEKKKKKNNNNNNNNTYSINEDKEKEVYDNGDNDDVEEEEEETVIEHDEHETEYIKDKNKYKFDILQSRRKSIAERAASSRIRRARESMYTIGSTNSSGGGSSDFNMPIRKASLDRHTDSGIALQHQSEYDSDTIEFTNDNHVKGGTLSALVERLTAHDVLDTSFIATFLLTYRSFCTTKEFITLLETRYNVKPPKGVTPDELEVWTERKQKLIRLRVFNIMKNWLENYYIDEDFPLLARFDQFTNGIIRDTFEFAANQLDRLIRKRVDSGMIKKIIPNQVSGPEPLIPKNITNIQLHEIQPLELARQLSIMDFKLYSSIRPIELLGKAWSKEEDEAAVEKNSVAKNIKASIHYCNRLTSWVTDSILIHDEAKRRALAVKFWVHVADYCRGHNNYNTCMAILSAFDNSAIGRLKRTWVLVNKNTLQTLSQIRKLMGANRNFTEYREIIHSVNPPCIPFLGIYLQDLTFIEDGNPDYLRKSKNLINFAKRNKAAEVIRELKQFQSFPFNFIPIQELQDFIKLHLDTNHDVEKLYEKSLLLEPRVTESSNNNTV